MLKRLQTDLKQNIDFSENKENHNPETETSPVYYESQTMPEKGAKSKP